VLLGHSFIKGLERFMLEDVEDANLRLYTDKFQVIICARGGLRVPQFSLHCIMQVKLWSAECLVIVFLQIGGNDIRNNCNIYSINYLRSGVPDPHKGCSSYHYRTTFTAKTDCCRSDVHSHVINTNKGIESWCRQSDCAITFWKHQGFGDTDMNYLAVDGVHLNKNKYMRKYLQSIKSAVLHASWQW
jgi:hypothetical protein